MLHEYKKYYILFCLIVTQKNFSPKVENQI